MHGIGLHGHWNRRDQCEGRRRKRGRGMVGKDAKGKEEARQRKKGKEEEMKRGC